MPGVRLGYCVSSDPALGEALFAAGQPWPVSVLAEAAGEAALASPDWERESAAKIAVWRAELAVGFSALGLWVSESESNFCLFRTQCRTQKRTRQGFALLRRADFRFATARTFAGFPRAIFELR